MTIEARTVLVDLKPLATLAEAEHYRAVGANALFSVEHWQHNAGSEWADVDDGSYTAFEHCAHPQCKAARSVLAALDASPPSLPTSKAGVCGKCGGPHRFDTSVPSHQWNRVIRAAGLPDYLCTTCIVAAFVLAKEGFTAELYGRSDGQGDPLDESADGFDLHGDAIEVRVGGRELDTVRELRDENNRLRSALGELNQKHPLLVELCRPPEPSLPTPARRCENWEPGMHGPCGLCEPCRTGEAFRAIYPVDLYPSKLSLPTAREVLEWQPIETLVDPDERVLMWTPVDRMYLPPFDGYLKKPEMRVSTKRNWNWATHWMPLPAPPKAERNPR